MILCLSSGSSERYRQDILRALGLPVGADLQFRYSDSLVEDAVLQRARNATLAGEDVLICYARSPGPTDDSTFSILDIVPVRFGKIRRADLGGSTLVLTISVTGIASSVPSDDLTAFTRDLCSSSAFLCRNISRTDAVGVSRSLSSWEEVVRALSEHPDFSEEPVFAIVVSIGGRTKTTEQRFPRLRFRVRRWFRRNIAHDLPLKNLPRQLPSSGEFEVRVYHWRQGELKPSSSYALHLRTGPKLEIQSTNSLTVDSSYDLKAFVVRSAGEVLYRRGTWVSVDLVGSEGVRVSLETNLRIGRTVAKPLLSAVVIAAAVFAAQATPIWMGSAFEDRSRTIPTAIVASASAVVGLAAAFGIRRGP